MKELKNLKISQSIHNKALSRKILNLRIKASINKYLQKEGLDFINIIKIKIDEFNLNSYWNNEYNNIIKEIKEGTIK